MLLASRGANAVARVLKPKIPRPLTKVKAAANIHIPTATLQQVSLSAPTSIRIQTAKTAITRLLHNVLPRPATFRANPSFTRAAHTSTIRQSLSLPTRFALGGSRPPLGTPFMPRSPDLVSRSVANVGLGTARQFSSARPVFQNLVQNVPIAARAFCEVDLDLGLNDKVDMKRRRAMIRRAVKAQKKQALQTKSTVSSVDFSSLVESTTPIEETDEMLAFSHYFSVAPEEPFTTTLIVPLAPEGARAPLPLTAESSTYDIIAGTHVAYSRHSVRVAALFRRLDVANVWERGAQCAAIGGDGVVSALVVRFEGWSEDTLRGVLGEAGRGWCRVESVPTYPAIRPVEESEYVMPVIDFAASFYADEQYALGSGRSDFSGITTPDSSHEDSDGSSDASWTQSLMDSSIRFSSSFEDRL